MPYLEKLPPKSVVAICGPSGSGKSEIASLIGTYFIKRSRPSYVLSCDNYPWRPPRANDKHRERIHAAQGAAGLEEYLGTPNEIDFDRIAEIVHSFRDAATEIPLRIMDTVTHRVLDDWRPVSFKEVDVLVLEGTWSGLVEGTNLRVFLNTNFAETLEHRRKRARDPITPFGELVLGIEQKKLERIRDSRCHLAIDFTCKIDELR
jgi:alpha-galactosidase